MDFIPSNSTGFNNSEAKFFPFERFATVLKLSILSLLLLLFKSFVGRLSTYDDDFPIVNRTFALEPRIFSRIRFAFNSQKILEDAYKKVSQLSSPPLDRIS
jgi:hypothetical protein